MLRLNKILWGMMVALAVQGCVKRVNVATRNEAPILVVEGSITTDSVPYSVRLSYSGNFSLVRDLPPALLVEDATVSIRDDQGRSTALVYIDSGRYQTTDANYVGQVGRSYYVDIVLKDGKRYISKPEQIKPARPIDNINVRFVNEFNIELPTYLEITADVDDPADEENYYQWTYDAYIQRQTLGVPCGFYCVRFEFCYQKQLDNETRILSDQFVNGNLIRNQPVGRTYIYTFGNPYVSINQLSISREAYQFWKRYQDQQARTGSILDPLPAAIKGNVYNASDETDFALGYFSAASVTNKKLILIPQNITQYLLDISARIHIQQETIACFEYYDNALSYPDGRYPPPPAGWENAEQRRVYW